MYKIITEIQTKNKEQAEKIYEIMEKYYGENPDIKKLDIDVNIYMEQNLEV